MFAEKALTMFKKAQLLHAALLMASSPFSLFLLWFDAGSIATSPWNVYVCFDRVFAVVVV